MVIDARNCPARKLPKDASIEEREAACSSCLVADCKNRDASFSSSTWKYIAIFCLSFCVTAVILFIVKMFFFH